MEVPDDVAIVAMDLQDPEEMMVSMVRRQDCEENGNCLITVDSGADISVLFKHYAGVGERQEAGGQLKMVDAQGKKIPHSGMTRARVRMVDRKGKVVEIYEDFALGSVQRPILCAGKLLKRGWSLGEVEGSLHLRHEGRSVGIPLNMERNSLQCEARIFAVQASEDQAHQEKRNEEEAARVQVLQGYLSKYVQELEMTPGWHRLPNGVAVYSDPVATQLVDPSGSSQDDIDQGKRWPLGENKEDIGKNVTQIDFCYTYTGEEDRSEKPVQDKVLERQDQHGTVLVMTSSETKAIQAVPVPSKGSASLKTITEEIVRFALENSARDACIIQADSERATRQTLRSVQQVRNVLGMKTEI